MNDFSELENELKKLRPAQPSAGLLGRVEEAMMDDSNIAEEKIIRPVHFRINRVALGFGLAAAAVFILFARINMDRLPKQPARVARVSPAPETRSTSFNQFVPTGATRVVYNTRDEGLHFADGYQEPLRRVRYQTNETLQWHNPATGASLRVSYPSEEIVMTPISGQ
jgi:hypothetical protein